ncbi:putative membrane-bound acyltransferase YkrP [Halolactibacillus alkaliphilus]|uniref:Putative membrane-bound acyltransferase YkrP n=1 Tax=Halolactibacillus alkaliphilus TaxID=442899 RepID=A0A511X274_9BACI|nr:acyltransferase family protein [Halolactibacillus alkaliphilus]GEN57055.1 putative membrane-bound acyltransferase YkrP [Halolactibacillus alkaliphilus]GGN68644.1 putative membrane-bound acyltransferase YkrP [Halolactibacillus alkaliphilus]SFO86035.1 Fucose 4-O-acetylase [Halolactibacillus alkaliphilus]
MKREYFFDNARVILIFLVVFGHVIQSSTGDSKVMMALYQSIYLFHMPAMIFVSGYFAKGIWDKRYIINLIKKIIFPYIVFQLLYNMYNLYSGDAIKSVFEPNWSLWFLLSLFSWHMLLIFVKKLPAKIGMILAVGVGLGVGYIDQIGHVYSLSRTCVFFPFFLLGYHMDKAWLFHFMDKLSVKKASVCIGVVVMLHVRLDYPVSLLFGSSSYQDLGYLGEGFVYRLLSYLGAVLLTYLFFVIVPRREVTYSKIGEQTLYVYLLHGAFIQLFRRQDWFHVDGLFTLVIALLVSGVIVLFLSSKYVTTLFKPVIEFKRVKEEELHQLFKRWRARID